MLLLGQVCREMHDGEAEGVREVLEGRRLRRQGVDGGCEEMPLPRGGRMHERAAAC